MHEYPNVDFQARSNDGASIGKSNAQRVTTEQIIDSHIVRGASDKATSKYFRDPSRKVLYQNFTDKVLVVTTRDGCSMVLPAIGYGGDELIVTVTQSMSRSSMERSLDNLRKRMDHRDPETRQWIIAYEEALSINGKHTYLSASIEYVASLSKIEGAGGRCYMPDTDLLVELEHLSNGKHPFDKSQRNQATFQATMPGVGDDTFVFMLKAVDNAPHRTRGDRYVNYGGSVYRVPIERDESYLPGVHLVSRVPISKDGKYISDIISSHFTFEEADKKFGLRMTPEEAEIGGPLNDMAKMIIDHQTTVKRVEEARLRTEQLGVESHIQRLKNEGALSKALQDKDATDRRNYVEWVKTGAALLGTAITIYGILSNLTSK